MGWLFKKLLLDNHPGASRHPSCPGGAIAHFPANAQFLHTFINRPYRESLTSM